MSSAGVTTTIRNHAQAAIKSFLKCVIPSGLRPVCRRCYWVVYGYSRWRWSQLCAIMMATQFRQTSAEVVRRVKSSARPHRLPAPLIVSLTSYPPRFNTLSLTLHSLLRQTVAADRTILWIAHADIPLLPKDVTDLRSAGLEIRTTQDIKSYKKIIPVLDAFPDAFICTVDDDVYYWPTWLERLAEQAGTSDRLVVCYRAHEIMLDPQGRFRPYKEWPQDAFRKEESKLLFPTGMGGVLYPPGILIHTAEDREAALDLSPHNDDIWLYWIARRNGAIYKTISRRREFIMWPRSQVQSLWHTNVELSGNDYQIQKMAERYGYPAP